MRIAFTADSQVDEHSRLAEHDRVMEFVCADARLRGCAALIHGGDVYERRSTVRERESVNRWIDDAADTMAVMICGGNHEAAGEVAELGGPRMIEAVESPSVAKLTDLWVAFLPWPRRERLRAWFAAVHSREPSIEEANATARELLRDVIRGLGAELAMAPADCPRILVAHVAVEGYRTSPDQPAHVGEGMAVSVEDLMLAGADVVLLGHVHLPQEWVGVRADGVDVPVIYAGSPRRTGYASGELVAKSYTVVTFDGRAVTWERVPTPATPMILVDVAWDPDTRTLVSPGLGYLEQPSPLVGAEIRLRYSVASDQRDGARASAAAFAESWRAAGAAEVVVDEVVIATTRARAPEVAAAVGVAEKVRAVMRMRGDVDEARIERVAALVGEIEG